MSSLHEECGVFGIYSPKVCDAAKYAYYGLFALQHRGQESCGIVVNNDGLFRSYKDLGIVNDVFTQQRLESLGEGSMAVGHVRYGTTGGNARENAQPIVVNHIKGHMALAHNGNLTNALELRRELEMSGSIFHTTSDTEVISYVITRERLTSGSIEEAVSAAMDKLKGAYSLVIMSPAKLIAARDEHGFRPLCYGRMPDGTYVAASESCALDAVGAEFIRDLDAGEIVVFDEDGVRSIRTHCGRADYRMCVFEYVYFARPDSVIDGCSVHEARTRAGALLALEHPVQADVVIGVPDSGLDAAVGFAKQSGIPYEIGLIKNKYVARTFISPGQASRVDKVKIKLNPVRQVIAGKRVVLIDDSIVRGTTSARIVKLIRDAGAKEVHVRISAPPFVSPCFYGVDIDSKENLIACHYSIDEIAQKIGADSLGYLSISGVKEIAGAITGKTCCTACFDGSYPTEVPADIRKSQFEGRLSETEKYKKKHGGD